MNIQEIIQSVKDGNGNPLEAYVLLKAFQEQVEEGLKELKDLAMNEAEKYGKSFDKFGAHIELRNAPSRWNFKGISAIESAEKKLAYLQNLAKIGGGVDVETGEEVPAASKVEGAQTIAIKLNKQAA